MNWRRGLLRVWLVCSLYWVVLIGLLTCADWPKPYQRGASLSELGACRAQHPNMPAECLAPHEWERDYTTVEIYAASAVAVPLFFFVIGSVMIWAIHGFRRP